MNASKMPFGTIQTKTPLAQTAIFPSTEAPPLSLSLGCYYSIIINEGNILVGGGKAQPEKKIYIMYKWKVELASGWRGRMKSEGSCRKRERKKEKRKENRKKKKGTQL